MSLINHGNNTFTIKCSDAFRFVVHTGKSPLKYLSAVIAFVFGKTVTNECLKNYVSVFHETPLARYVRDKNIFERDAQIMDQESVINIPAAPTADGVQPEVTRNKHTNKTLPLTPNKQDSNVMHGQSKNDKADHSIDKQPEVIQSITTNPEPRLFLEEQPQEFSTASTPLKPIQQVSPEIIFTKWLPIADQLEAVSGSEGTQSIVLDKDKYCINPLPDIEFGQNKLAKVSGCESELAAYAINIDLEISAAVDASVDIEKDVQVDIASTAKNISAEIDVAAVRYKEKPNTWKDFLEKNPAIIKKYHEQIKDAKDRHQNKKFDALYDNYFQNKMKYGPDNKKIKMMVSEEAAKKYHEIYCSGTAVDGYSLGQECVIHSNRRTCVRAAAHNVVGIGFNMHEYVATTENMCFNEVPAGFILIQEENNPNTLYICFDKDYCHPNSKTIPDKKTVPWTEDIVGLVPKFLLINREEGTNPELIVEGEDNYSYQNPPSGISNDFTKLLKSYSESITKVWYTAHPRKNPDEPPTLNEPSWNFRKHPFDTLANKDVHLIGDFNGKEALCEITDEQKKHNPSRIASPNLDFDSYESGMYEDHVKITKMAKLTTQYVRKIANKFFPDLANVINKLLSEERIKNHLCWSDECDDRSSPYCKALNVASSTSACALRQYQNGRRFLDALISVSKHPDSSKDLEEHLNLILSMEEVQTELCPDDYEAFYEDPAGHGEEGQLFSVRKPAIPVIRDNLVRGGLVLKPFRNPRNNHPKGKRFELGEMGYLEVTQDGSTLGYGSYDYKAIAVCVPGNQKKWMPMNYNYHTDSLIPLTEHEFKRFYNSTARGNDDKYKNYLTVANQVHSRVLVKDTASCSRPKRILTPSTNDLFGTGGLNVMSWPGMRNCALETSVDATRWKALLKEETALLKRYKALTPRGRAMAFEQALAFSNAKKQPYTEPQKIKMALDSAIYVTNIAIDAANGNEDEAAKLILPIRHLTHINMPGARMAGMQSDSLESRRVNMVNYIRMHRDPREGIINLRSKLINDPSASFLINGELEKETEMLEKQSNTFIAKEMLLHDKQPTCFIRKGRSDQKDDKVEVEVEFDYEVKRSSASASIDMTYYLYNLHDFGDIKKHDFKLKLDALSRKNKLEDMQDDTSLELLENNSKKTMGFIDNQYLDKDKVDRVCELSKNDPFCNLQTMFSLDMSKMKQKTESMMLEDTKNDVKILSALINEPKEKFQIKTHKRATIHTGQPTVLLNQCTINLISHKPLYTVVEGRKETEELEKAASEMTGALPIVDSDINIKNAIDLVAIGCAKAVALRALSTTTYRPAAHTCVDGINVMTRSKLFKELSADTQLDALRYTTAALTQEDCQVNNQYDFGLWEMLDKGESASPNSNQAFYERDARIKKKIEEITKITEKIHAVESLIEHYSNTNDSETETLAANQQFKEFAEFMNQRFEGLNLNANNADSLYNISTIENKSDIFLDGVNLYPKIQNATKKLWVVYPLSEDGKKAGLLFNKKAPVKDTYSGRLTGYKNELVALSKHYSKTKNDRPEGYPSEMITEMFIAELEKLRAKNVFLPLQDLKTAAKEISCNNQDKCIVLARQGKMDELRTFIASTIDKISEERTQKRISKDVLGKKFSTELKSESIVKSILELIPIKYKQECEAIQRELSYLASKSDPASQQKIETLKKKLKTLKIKNGIYLTDIVEIRQQVDKLQMYTQEIIKKGADAIATDYRHLLETSDGSIDDKLRLLAMVNYKFLLIHRSIPKQSQVAAMLASINSPSISQAICAEPGSGKSIYFMPALVITRQLGKRNENFPIFVTNNETLLQQDYENFKPWGRAFNFSVRILDTNFENNMKKYTTEKTMIFGTAEIVMGDRLRLDTLDLVDRFIDNDATDELIRCPNDKLLDLYTEGFKRGIVFDEFDTVKDKDCSGSLIVSETTTNKSDSWKLESYTAFFKVFEALGNKAKDWRCYLDAMVKSLSVEMESAAHQKKLFYQSEIDKVKSMNQEEWSARIESLRSFIMKKHQFKLQKTYTIGYETLEKGSSSKKTVVTIPNPSKAVIEEQLAQGHVLKIFPINQTTAEMVRNASFADNASNYLACMHGLPPSPPSQVLASASAQTFFEENFGEYGICTLTATYGSGKMLDDLIPEGRTNIFYQAPYKLDLVTHTPQLFESQTDIYDNVVNMAGHYIEQGMDVIILSSEQSDVFALDRALGLYSQANKNFKEKADVWTLANLRDKPDHMILEEDILHLDTPFDFTNAQGRQQGTVINATDACARGFNFKACNAVLISVGCPASERARLQKYRRVGRKGNKGIVHSLMKQDVLTGSPQSFTNATTEQHGGRHGQGIDNRVEKMLLSKDAIITQRALVRNKIQTVVMNCGNILMAYYQQLKVMEALSQNQLPMTKKMKEKLDGIVKDITPGMADKTLQAWYKWRDSFVEKSTKQCKTPEEADEFINQQLGEKKTWHNFITQQPYYNAIVSADFSHRPEEMPSQLQFPSKEELFFQSVVKLENRLYKKLHTALKRTGY
ncbi:MAG: DEAD/DEAH box helicase family protein [Endozoicomonadaceae bacterium]|nr:DEAD/DEAH box helicase family protein [Endozoicomonadaceae bacterium]